MSGITAEAAAAKLLNGHVDDVPENTRMRGAHFIADSLASVAAEEELRSQARSLQKAMAALNGIRHFDATHLIGQAWHSKAVFDPVIHKHLAQALIERGELSRAEVLLRDAAARATASGTAESRRQLAEYQGLTGRIHKQRFVASGDLDDLCKATEAYLQQYRITQSYYHGVNVLALYVREAQETFPPREGIAVQTLAHQLHQATLNARASDTSHWPLATLSEICLALDGLEPNHGWADAAELWLHRFLSHAQADAFAIESYHRQLREVWRGDALRRVSAADQLVAVIAQRQMRQQHRWAVDAQRIQQIHAQPDLLEKNFSGEKAFTVGDLQRMVNVCPAIGCVADAAGVRKGTGFLMTGAAFGLPQPLVFVTNAHVISDDVPDALMPQEARVSFEIESTQAGSARYHAVQQLLFSSPPADVGVVLEPHQHLDVSIVALASYPESVSALPKANNLPLPRPTTKAFVVGHPKAGPLQFSLTDSVLLDVCDQQRLLHYRTPTEPGSSGSPVFNAKWEVIALHHAGSQAAPRLRGQGTYEANEGIALGVIVEAAQAWASAQRSSGS